MTDDVRQILIAEDETVVAMDLRFTLEGFGERKWTGTARTSPITSPRTCSSFPRRPAKCGCCAKGAWGRESATSNLKKRCRPASARMCHQQPLPDLFFDVFDRDGRYLGNVEGLQLTKTLPFVSGNTVIAPIEELDRAFGRLAAAAQPVALRSRTNRRMLMAPTAGEVTTPGKYPPYARARRGCRIPLAIPAIAKNQAGKNTIV